jgi:phosphatidylglycerophosphatase C
MAADAGVSTAHRNPRPGVAAFDFDGTLVARDSLGPFLAELLGRRRCADVLVRSGLPMLAGYWQRGRDGAKEALLLRAVAGLRASAVSAAGATYGARLASRLRPAMADQLVWHRAQGHRLVLVSASLADYLVPFAQQVGFDDKVVRLTALLGPGPVELWAYGDSAGDRQLLAMADHPSFVGRWGLSRHRNGNRPD